MARPPKGRSPADEDLEIARILIAWRFWNPPQRRPARKEWGRGSAALAALFTQAVGKGVKSVRMPFSPLRSQWPWF